MKASRIALATGPLRVLIPNLEERLKHASEARKSMLAKFKMSLVEGPAAIEKRQQRQIIAAARAARAAQREEARLHQERDRAKQAELAAQAVADAERAAAEQAARDARPDRPGHVSAPASYRGCLRL